MKIKELAKFLLKITVSVLLLYLLIKRIDYSSLIGALKQISLFAVILSFAFYCATAFINAYRWNALLPGVKYSKLLQTIFTAQFFSTVLPGQLFGEASKIASLHNEKCSDIDITISVLADKIMGMCGLAFVGFIGCVFSKASVPAVLKYGYLSIFLIIILLFLVPSIFKRFGTETKTIALPEKVTGIAEKLKEILNRYANNYSLVIKTVSLSALSQFFGACQLYGAIYCLGYSTSFFDCFWIFASLSLILFIPVSIGGLGLREASLSGFLSLFLIPEAISFSASMLVYASQLIAAVIGMLFWGYGFLRKGTKINV